MSTGTDPHARVAAVFPELGARDVHAIGTGWTVDTYEVDGDWIVQFPRDERAAERLRAQIETLPELAAELSALVPEPTHVNQAMPAIAYRKIAGAPLDEAPDGLWPERLGRFLYDLHLMPPEYVGLRGRGPPTRAPHTERSSTGSVSVSCRCSNPVRPDTSVRDSPRTSTTTISGGSRPASCTAISDRSTCSSRRTGISSACWIGRS